MSIDRPIFILGSGRSGTTILNYLLSMHPDLCWTSNVSMRLPYVPFAPITQRVLDMGEFGWRQKKKILARKTGALHVSPVEAKSTYDRIGLRRDIKLTEEHYTPELDARFRKVVERHLFWSGKPRFVSKETSNNQRYRLLNRLFPDAIFIHLVRDGRAVVNSIQNKDWLPVLDLWWTGDKAIDRVKDYDDPIQLIGDHWKHNVEELLHGKDVAPGRYIELRYEELIDDVHSVLHKIVDFADLSDSERFFSLLPETLPNMNEKWRTDLSSEQISALQKTIGSELQKLGYSV
jgi:hypothetical protein